jgi:hypothetical protein
VNDRGIAELEKSWNAKSIRSPRRSSDPELTPLRNSTGLAQELEENADSYRADPVPHKMARPSLGPVGLQHEVALLLIPDRTQLIQPDVVTVGEVGEGHVLADGSDRAGVASDMHSEDPVGGDRRKLAYDAAPMSPPWSPYRE